MPYTLLAELEAATAQASAAKTLQPHAPDEARRHYRNAITYLRRAAGAAGYVLVDADEPPPLDPEIVAARQESYRRQIEDAGRGELQGAR